MAYRLTNNSRAPRGIYNKAGRLVMINPKQSVDVDLSDVVANRLVGNSKAGSKLRVSEAGAKSESKRSTNKNSVQNLLDEAEDMNYFDLKAKAKEVLGDKMPSGQLKKEEIIDVLKENV